MIITPALRAGASVTPCITTRGRAMNEQELINALIESAKREKNFSAMTNDELADFLMNEVWAHLNLGNNILDTQRR